MRLKGWVNPYKVPDASVGVPIQMFSGDIMYAFEAGADAYEDGLKKETQPVVFPKDDGTVGMFLPVLTHDMLMVITRMALSSEKSHLVKVQDLI